MLKQCNAAKVLILSTSLNTPHNYCDGPTKLFISEFLDISVKLLFVSIY